MSIVLELSPEEEALLEREAQVRGMDITTYVRERVFAPEANRQRQAAGQVDIEFLRKEGLSAVRNAQKNLLIQNIGYVFSRDGRIVRHNADGSEDVLSTASKDACSTN